MDFLRESLKIMILKNYEKKNAQFLFSHFSGCKWRGLFQRPPRAAKPKSPTTRPSARREVVPPKNTPPVLRRGRAHQNLFRAPLDGRGLTDQANLELQLSRLPVARESTCQVFGEVSVDRCWPSLGCSPRKALAAIWVFRGPPRRAIRGFAMSAGRQPRAPSRLAVGEMQE